MVLRAYMMIIRGGCRPAWAAAAVDAGYARRPLAAWAVRAVSPGGQARAGGRTDVELLIALSDDTPGLRDVEPFSWCASVL